uniref:Ovule protein n=1 Tax=Heterorhabditis bacteriophora TaxID=37862 RepID=A0A1I7WF52_HETBA
LISLAHQHFGQFPLRDHSARLNVELIHFPLAVLLRFPEGFGFHVFLDEILFYDCYAISCVPVVPKFIGHLVDSIQSLFCLNHCFNGLIIVF